MGTEVLRPQNCLSDRIKVSPPAIFHRRWNNANRKPPVRPNHHRRRWFGSDEFTIEKVTILRRGESFDSISKIERFSPEVYAGSATLVVSPAPSSLPLPSFSRKANSHVVVVKVDDSASRDLRRLLRLEF